VANTLAKLSACATIVGDIESPGGRCVVPGGSHRAEQPGDVTTSPAKGGGPGQSGAVSSVSLGDATMLRRLRSAAEFGVAQFSGRSLFT